MSPTVRSRPRRCLRRPPAVLALAGLMLLPTACGRSAPAGDTILVAAGSGADSARVPVAAVELARSSADTLGARLMSRLREALQDGGPTAALAVCAEAAPALTADMQTPRRTIRRVSERWRTARDRPDPFERVVLGEMASGQATGAPGEAAPEVLRVEEAADGRWLRYMRPIHAVEMCMGCHGPEAELDAGVRAALAERYPDDRATGHQVGDLRGAFSVRVKLDDAG